MTIETVDRCLIDCQSCPQEFEDEETGVTIRCHCLCHIAERMQEKAMSERNKNYARQGQSTEAKQD